MYGGMETSPSYYDEDSDVKRRMNHIDKNDLMMQKMETVTSLMHVMMEMMRRTNINHWDYDLLTTLQKEAGRKLMEIDFEGATK